MQNIINEVPAKKNYDFIDAIRCIAMMSIVADHCIYFEPVDFHPVGLNTLFYNGTIQFSKFGTISFFLIAGFLIGDNFTKYTPLQYLKRRIDSTIWPWVFWSLFFIFITNTDVISNKLFSHIDPPGTTAWQYMFSYAKTTYLFTMYWFIPNFLFCITLLLIFKKYLYNYIFGGILFLFTLFYSVNIYFLWVIPSHTTAILGFVFFLWLGAQLHKKWASVDKWISRQPMILLVIITIVAFGFGLTEITFLKNQHSADPYNSLRFSNILYSLCCFLILLKIRNFDFIKKLKPRETTYGVYLIHYIIVIRLLGATFYKLHIDLDHLNPLVLFIYQIIRFSYVYLIVMLIVLLINKTKFKWLIGR